MGDPGIMRPTARECVDAVFTDTLLLEGYTDSAAGAGSVRGIRACDGWAGSDLRLLAGWGSRVIG